MRLDKCIGIANPYIPYGRIANPPEQNANPPEQNANSPEQKANPPEQNANLPEQKQITIINHNSNNYEN